MRHVLACYAATAIVAVTASIFGIVESSAFEPKSITIKVGYGAGGTYDLSSRLVARHLGRFLPGNPSFVVENVPGGGSLKLTKLMLGSEPADGTVLASVSSGMAFAPKLDPQADFDPLTIRWIGSLSKEPAFCTTTKKSGIDTIDKFTANEFLVGASGKNSQTYLFAAMAKNGLDAKYNIVTGFSGVAEIDLAIERGEVAGQCAVTTFDLTTKHMLETSNVIGRFGATAPKEFEAIPRFSDKIADPVAREAAELIESTRDFNYPLIAPPGTPLETLKVLREAYTAMTKDPEFVAEVKRLGEFDLNPTSGEAVTEIVEKKLQSDASVFEAARALLK